MFTPLTIAIFSGALSPYSLEGQPHLPGRLQQATWRLKGVCGSAGELTGQLRDILSGWQVELPLPVCDIHSTHFSSLPDADTSAILSHRREAEMEYVISVCYCEERPKLSYQFYDALLRAEARWLKQWLEECIANLHSVSHARLLLCRVLEEVYATGVLVDEACRCQLHENLCCQLKGSLASLYLMLTIDFGHLLHPADYKDYRALMCDTSYQHPILRNDALVYDILQLQNRVIALFSSASAVSADASVQIAMQLYRQQSALLVALDDSLRSDHRLYEGIVALENYLFFRLGNHALCEGNLYCMLTDKQWMNDSLVGFCEQEYAGHKSFSEARGAADWVGRRLNERCLSFLNLQLLYEGSIPRRLHTFLLRRRQLYEDNYSRSFVPTQAEGQLSVVPSGSVGAGWIDVDEIHNFMAFLYRARDNNGNRFISHEHAAYLEDSFISFLNQGVIEVAQGRKVKVLKKFSGVLYGLFFHYCERKGVRSNKDCAHYLVAVIDEDMQVDSLLKNAKRSIKQYEAYVKEKPLPLLMDKEEEEGRSAESPGGRPH